MRMASRQQISIKPVLGATICALALFVAVPPSVGKAQSTEGPSKNPQDLLQHKEAIQKLVKETMMEKDLKAVILGVNVGNERVLTIAAGESMAGVPAAADMQVRLGAIAIPYLASVLLQLEQEGVLSLNDPLAKYLPELPLAKEVSLKMLINCTSGYPDYVTYDKFLKAFYADVFRTWSAQELIDIAFEQPMHFKPGEGWSYAHTNFVILGEVIKKATGHPLTAQIQERIIAPFGLSNTFNPPTPAIPQPVLHAYTRERGVYEEGTFWNPSWTLPEGAIMTANLEDILISARAIGTGRQLSEKSFARMVAPDTAGIKPWSEDTFFGLGVVVNNGWIAQNPSFHGFAGFMGYLPDKDLSVAIFTTKKENAEIDPNESVTIFQRLSEVLTPENAIKTRGGK